MKEGRGIMFEDLSKPKKRWDAKTHEPQVIIEDERSRARLKHLRGLSKELNHILQSKLEEARLPYSSSHKGTVQHGENDIDYPRVLRMSVQLRPEFYKSDEEKNTETRYTAGDDEITVFIHVRDDNTIQLTRTSHGYTQTAYGLYFEFSIMPDLNSPGHDVEKKLLEQYIKENDINGVADYLVRRLIPDPHKKKTFAQSATETFQRAYKITSVEEARKYFNEEQVSLYQAPEFLRNLGKVVIVSVLEHTLLSHIEHRSSLAQIKVDLQKISQELLNIPCDIFPKPKKLESCIPDAAGYIRDTIATLTRAYKPKIFGWEK